MHLTLLEQGKKPKHLEIDSLTLPGATGTFQIYPDHIRLVRLLGEGKVLYTHQNKNHVACSIEQGIVSVDHNNIKLMSF